MCTAMTYKTNAFYFGRTLDYDLSFGEAVTVTPRNYPFRFRHTPVCTDHYAMIGMAHVSDGYPLYYDAVNEKGLCMAGLNFVGNAVYKTSNGIGTEVAQFELIPWVLSQCATLREAKQALQSVKLVDTPFSARYPVANLHWMAADKTGCIVIESTQSGLCIHDNPIGVLTNNPPFERQLTHWRMFEGLSNEERAQTDDPTAFTRGTGAVGLPGDLSSPSRFVRAAFTRKYSISKAEEADSVVQFFHMLGTVEQTRGCCKLGEGRYEITQYTSCCNATNGTYYYTTYGNPRISAVDLYREELQGNRVIAYPLVDGPQIFVQN